MLKRLLALFGKKQSSQKTFEEKLEKLGDYDLTARVDRQGRTHFARDEQDVRLHRALHPGYQPKPFRGNVAPPPKRPNRSEHSRGMTRNVHAENHTRNDDLILGTMMAHTIIDTPAPLRHHDVDTCQTTPYHTPSGGYDSSPSDGGSYDGGGGGGSCD